MSRIKTPYEILNSIGKVPDDSILNEMAAMAIVAKNHGFDVETDEGCKFIRGIEDDKDLLNEYKEVVRDLREMELGEKK